MKLQIIEDAEREKTVRESVSAKDVFELLEEIDWNIFHQALLVQNCISVSIGAYLPGSWSCF